MMLHQRGRRREEATEHELQPMPVGWRDAKVKATGVKQPRRGTGRRPCCTRRRLLRAAALAVALAAAYCALARAACTPIDAFIHIPKTGGTSTSFALLRLGLLAGALGERICAPLGLGLASTVRIREGYADRRLHHVPRRFWLQQPAPHAAFCVVRDPFARALSEAQFRFKTELRELAPERVPSSDGGGLSETVMRQCSQDVLEQVLRREISASAGENVTRHHYHWAPQATHVFDAFGNQLCDDVLCFEDVFRGGDGDVGAVLLQGSPALRRLVGTSFGGRVRAAAALVASEAYLLFGRLWVGSDFAKTRVQNRWWSAESDGCDSGGSRFSAGSRELVQSFYKADFDLRRRLGCAAPKVP